MGDITAAVYARVAWNSATIHGDVNARTPDHSPIDQDLFCQQCGYNLRGLTGETCPECGESIVGVRSASSRIPWVHRGEHGWWRAYWRTLAFVMFHQRRFAEEMARPVDYRESQRFRWVTVGIAYAPIFVAAMIGMLEDLRSPTDNAVFNVCWTNGWLGAFVHAGFLLFLAAATGAPSYFFHPRGVPVEQQNRAIALSYYACGPLSLLVLPVIALFLRLHVGPNASGALLAELLAVILPMALLAVWWLDLIHLARRLLPQSPRRTVALAGLVPMLWLALFVATTLGVPAIVLYLLVIVRSLG